MQVFKSTKQNIIVAGDVIFYDIILDDYYIIDHWKMTTTIRWRHPIDLITVSSDMDIFTDRWYCINYMPYVYKVRGNLRRYLNDCINLSVRVMTCVIKKCDIQQPGVLFALLCRILDLLY